MLELVISISNRIPFSIEKSKEDGTFSVIKGEGGLATALSELNNMFFAGTVSDDDFSDDEKNYLTKEYLKINSLPIFVKNDDYDKYYNGMSNSILWPALHYEHPDDSAISNFTSLYNSYISINEKIAKGMYELIKQKDNGQIYSDIVLGKVQLKFWVHDYHLFPLPTFLKNYFPTAKIGFYLHIPFPAYDFIKFLPKIKKIISLVMESDLIGFHTELYKNNFLHFIQQTNKKCQIDKTLKFENKCILALPIKSNYNTFSKAITKDNFDIYNFIRGIENYTILSNLTLPTSIHKDKEAINGVIKVSLGFDLSSKKWQEEINGKIKTILGVDRSDTIKGLLHKLNIFENLLQLYPEWVGKVEFVQVIIPSRLKVAAVKTMMKIFFEKVIEINNNYSTNGIKPVRIINNSVSLQVLKALYNQSDCMIISSLRDGMNLVALEYLEAQSEENPGVLLVSKLCGVYEFIQEGVVGINPWNKEKSAKKLFNVLKMEKYERINLFGNISNHIKSENTKVWAYDFIKLLGTNNKHL
jgi:trehalose-6-phosphate synthase